MIRNRFISICSAAIASDNRIGGTDCHVLEPFFQQLIELAEEDGENLELKECFFDIIRGEIDAPHETLAYCMRALRFREVAEESKKRLGTRPDPRWINTHSDILHALDDEIWEDAKLWDLIK